MKSISAKGSPNGTSSAANQVPSARPFIFHLLFSSSGKSLWLACGSAHSCPLSAQPSLLLPAQYSPPMEETTWHVALVTHLLSSSLRLAIELPPPSRNVSAPSLSYSSIPSDPSLTNHIPRRPLAATRETRGQSAVGIPRRRSSHPLL